MNWIKIEDQVPEDGQKVITYFELLNNKIEIATYKNLWGRGDKMFGHNMFYNENGWLTDDVTHWMPWIPGMPFPDPPQAVTKGDWIDG
jgi:hypothetical protein